MSLTVKDLRAFLRNPEITDDMLIWLDGDNDFATEVRVERIDFGQGPLGVVFDDC